MVEEINRRHCTTGINAWAMEGASPAEVAEKIRTLPADLQPWVARIIWWDKYSHLYAKTNELMGWVRTHSVDNPDPDRIATALVECGYTEHMARLRACGGDGQTVRYVEGVPQQDIRTLPFEKKTGAGGVQTRCGFKGHDSGFYRLSLSGWTGW